MRVFVSSVISGFERERDVAERAARTLGHDVIRAEQYLASPVSPQQACLAGVREADVVVLLLGSSYGTPQASGLSPTHEEYREARERRDILAFVQKGVEYEPEQRDFISEVRQWSSGLYTENFMTPTELESAITRALHRLELAKAKGRPDEAEMLARAEALALPERRLGIATLCLAVTGGPRQQVLRPAELEDPELGLWLQKEATFGRWAVFDPSLATTREVEEHSLMVAQDGASVLVDELGAVRVMQPAIREVDREAAVLSILIEEDIREAIERGLRLAGFVLDHTDPLGRLTHVSVVAALLEVGYLGWRTRAEHQASPRSVPVGKARGRTAVRMAPPSRNRSALLHGTEELAEDLTVLLRREVRS